MCFTDQLSIKLIAVILFLLGFLKNILTSFEHEKIRAVLVDEYGIGA